MYYNYWTVRYVPDVIRGEFVNIGLLVGRDGADWAFREVSSLRRANRLGGDPTICRYWLRELHQLVSASDPASHSVDPDRLWQPDEGDQAMSEGTLAHLRGRLNNAVQISDARRLIADTATHGLDLLFEHLVADPVPTSRIQFRSRISRVIEDSFYRGLVNDTRARVERRPAIHVGRSEKTADLAITDNEVEQLTKAWSFNLANVEAVQTEIEAWAYFMGEIREGGASLITTGKTRLRVPEEVQFRVIYEEPKSPERQENLAAAKEIWDRVDGLKTYSASQAEDLVRDGLSLVA